MPNIGINGDLYNAIKNIYAAPLSCVQLGGHLTDWFPITSGVRQGDSLSPILFAIYINDLAEEIRNAEAGVYIGGKQLPMLMYADDIVMISPSPTGAQNHLDILSEWCAKWMMKINAKKSEIVHV